MSDAYFVRTTFTEEACFEDARFGAEADFRKSSFGEWADFSYSEFVAGADFSDVQFSAAVSFILASFNGWADFSNVTFCMWANFYSAKFGAELAFESAAFGGQVSFTEAVFDQPVNFSAVDAVDCIIFSASESDGSRSDGTPIGSRALGKNPDFDFQNSMIEKPDKVSFHTAALRPNWFVNVDSRMFVFTDVDWALATRNIKQEIDALVEKEISSPHRLLAIACRQLAENAEANNRYEEASSFRYWAMDLARHYKWRGAAFWKTDWLHMLYWAVSGYGEKIVRALGVLAAVWFVFVLLYTQVGFAKPESRSETARARHSTQVHALSRIGYTRLVFDSSFKKVDRMKKRLSAKRKSELCLICGKCCMSMTFSGGEVDDEARDEIHWMELHGLKIDYVEEQGRTEYYFTIPKRCDALQEVKTPSGATNYVCGVYETRPQMCRDYDGRMEGPQGVADCLWRLEENGLPIPKTNLVQLQAPSR